MKTRHLLIAAANLLLLASAGLCAWRASNADARAAPLPVPRPDVESVATVSRAWWDSPAMLGVTFIAGMFVVAGLAVVALRLAALHRPHWLTLPMKQVFVALPPSERTSIITTVQDYLMVVCTLCVSLIVFVAWHALGTATGAWVVPLGQDSHRAASVGAAVVAPFLVAATVLFAREYRQRVSAARRRSP